MSELNRMLSGKLYDASAPELAAARNKAHRLCRLYNSIIDEEKNQRSKLINELLGYEPKNCHIAPTFNCDYGVNIELGQNFFANFDCIILDVCQVRIGDNVMFGPRVCVYTAGHPLDAETRNTQLEFGTPVTMGNSVWVGGNTIILPGVTIGDNTVIGSGAVVTKSIPANVLAVGNPCQILRSITEEDKTYWDQLKSEYYAV